ncbi:uncharacterized protein LOC120694946 isoform X1 [Panicum virgatum]|uniref:Uncharacterized protein n=1 Tax=Panicum virgatum TaxID=38727 RepID=A0A8T0WRS7_PANVG|nr:uncharacterized protein LOC120694946 isoform X1 [Panicum virgatum]KAG2647834.1 hypothetical protein PVAP13_2KG108500 [Panicum virgatum]
MDRRRDIKQSERAIIAMMVSCKQVSCAEDAVQVRRRTHARSCYGPASDAEFLRSIADKTPGRDSDAAQRRRRQEYLKSYVFAKDEAEAAEARASRGGLVDAVLLRRRKTDDDNMAVGATCSSKQTDRWKAKAGKLPPSSAAKL